MFLFNRKNITLFLSLFFVLLISVGCSGNGEEGTSGQKAKGQKTVLRVNEKTVSKQEFENQIDRQMQRMGPGLKKLPEKRKKMIKQQLRNNLKQQMIQRLALQSAAKNSKFTVSDSEVNTFINDKLTKQQRKQARNQMKKQGEKLEDRAAEALLIQKYIQDNIGEIKVSSSEMRDYFEKNKNKFSQPEQVKARHILVNMKERKEAEAKKRAEEIKARLEQGSDFCGQATEYSDGPSAKSCGELGYFSRDRMAKPFSQVAFALEKGEISDPVKTQYGYHVIEKLDHRKAKPAKFSEVKNQVKKQLKRQKEQEKSKKLIDKLIAEADIEKNFADSGLVRPPQPGARPAQPQKQK